MLNPNSSSTSCSTTQGSQHLKGHNVTHAIPFYLLVLSPVNGILINTLWSQSPMLTGIYLQSCSTLIIKKSHNSLFLVIISPIPERAHCLSLCRWAQEEFDSIWPFILQSSVRSIKKLSLKFLF